MTDRLNTSVPIVERQDHAKRLVMEEPLLAGARVFMMNSCRIILNNEPTGWHLSISRADRDPSWTEIVTARYRLCPFVRDMAIILPPMEEYVNLHKFTFHLHEIFL